MYLRWLGLLLLASLYTVHCQKGRKNKCGSPPDVLYAEYTLVRWNKAQYTCNDGYEPVFAGLDSIRCRRGQWDILSFECIRSEVTCMTPPDHTWADLSHYGVNTDLYRPGHILCYTCSKGLVPSGNPVGYIECTEEGIWTSLTSSLQCDIPVGLEGQSENESIEPTSLEFLFERCGPAGKTEPTPPSKEKPSTPTSPSGQCPEPPEYPHMRIISGLGGPYIVGHEVDYKCLRLPFSSTSVLRTYCRQDGTWTTMNMMCLPVPPTPPPTKVPTGITPCGNPPDLPLAFYLETEQEYEFIYECEEGYRFLHSTFYKITCNPDTQQWEDEVSEDPRCVNIKDITTTTTTTQQPPEEDCSQFPPPSLENGYYQYQADEEAFIYACDEGYELVGESVYPCWTPKDSFPMPECIKKGTTTTTRQPPEDCSQFPPPSLENGYYQYQPDEEAFIYACDEGYELVGESVYPCWLDEDSFEMPDCVHIETPSPPEGKQCQPGDKPKTIRHGSYEYNPTTEHYQYTCEEGYDLVGVSWIQCIDGYWDMEPPRCDLVQCPEPGIPENGRRIDVDGKSFTVGNKVRYLCYSGYNLIGSEERTCQQNRKWTGTTVTCESKTKVSHCPVPAVPDGGRKNGDRYEVGSRVRFTCESGALLYGSRVRTCLASGKWSGEPPVCDPPLGTDTDEEVQTRLDYVFTDLTIKSHTGINIFFVFDASNSIEETEFRLSIQLALKLVGELGISTTTSKGATFGAATFASTATTIFQTNTYQTVDQCQQALNTMDRGHIGGRGTNIKSGLINVRRMIKFTQEKQVIRRSAKSVVILFSDGLHNEGGDPTMTADMLKEDGAEIYAVSMKTRNHAPNMKRRLAMLTSQPTRDHTVFTTNFNWNYVPDYSRCGPPGRTFFSATSTQGDSPAQGGAWPWAAQVYQYNLQTRQFVLACSAALIDPSHVVIASSCVRGTKGAKKVVFASVDGEVDANTQERYASHVFDEEHSNNYLAVLRLDKPVEINRNIRTVCLPEQDRADRYGVVLGWCSENKTASAALRQTDVQIKDVGQCSEIHLPVDPARENCIGSQQPRPGHCKKSCSSGNILVVEKVDTTTGQSQWTLSGVTMMEPGSCDLNTYMISSRVSAYMEWIRIIINREVPSPVDL